MAVTDILFEAAQDAMTRCHAPYSKFPVGAAILAEDGKVYKGANIENLAFPQGWCAECTAIGAMVMGGARRIIEIGVIAEKLAYCPPCGGCRQKIAEFADPSTLIHLYDGAGMVKTMTMNELLPFSFQTDTIDRG
ncbi:cytidine deaminase [Rhizobium sp. LjRoot254]|uniref:cytidine deaminase n=1 Tax=Rhizobium sp. LjRoot254 TaxID=3342297 RepID=UPI003ECDAEB8